MNNITEKICNGCGEKLPATNEYFCKNSKCKGGLRPKCKKCDKKYRQENKEHIESVQKKYVEENKEHLIERWRKYREKNLEAVRERNRKYAREHKEEYKKYREENSEYIKEKREKMKEYSKIKFKKYYQDNKEYIKAKIRIYKKENKDKVNILNQKRRTEKMKLPNNLTPNQWEEIKLKFNNRCAYCGQETVLAQDHFIPLSKGGEYTKNNIIPCCKSCNSKKHNSKFEEWYCKQEFYSKKREKFILKYLGYKEDIQQLKII